MELQICVWLLNLSVQIALTLHASVRMRHYCCNNMVATWHCACSTTIPSLAAVCDSHIAPMSTLAQAIPLKCNRRQECIAFIRSCNKHILVVWKQWLQFGSCDTNDASVNMDYINDLVAICNVWKTRYSHTKPKLFSRGVPGFATIHPCSV